MKASHNVARVAMTFDDDTLLPNCGLTVAALLAQRLGVADLVDEHITVVGEAARVARNGFVGLSPAGAPPTDFAAPLRMIWRPLRTPMGCC